MAYTWELDESIPDGIDRLMTELIDFALTQLKDKDDKRDKAVHETRKSFKKMRAILRLIRDELGEAEFQKQNAFYRDLGRKLSPVRDTFVLVKIIDGLIEEIDDKAVKKAARTIHKDLKAEFRSMKADFWQSGEAVTEVITALENERAKTARLLIQRDSFDVFKRGLGRVYQRGQKRMDIAYAKIPSPVGFHDWRKRVKYLWYQIQILKPIHPRQLTEFMTQLEQLANLLGDAHDFAVLYQKIENHPEAQHGAGRQLLAYIDQKRGASETSARPIGKMIYMMDSEPFIKQIQDWWKNPEPLHA